MKLPVKIGLREDRYVNNEIVGWIESRYDTKEKRAVAWDMLRHIKRQYPATIPILRGKLIDSKESEFVSGGIDGNYKRSDECRISGNR